MRGNFWSAYLVEDVFCLHGIILRVSVDLEVGKQSLQLHCLPRCTTVPLPLVEKTRQNLIKDGGNRAICLNSSLFLPQSVKWSPERQLACNLRFPQKTQHITYNNHGILPICSSTGCHHPACLHPALTSQYAWQHGVAEAGWSESPSWNWQNTFPDIFRIFHRVEISWDSTSDSSSCSGRLK